MMWQARNPDGTVQEIPWHSQSATLRRKLRRQERARRAWEHIQHGLVLLLVFAAGVASATVLPW
jgi:hypothetical protein